MPSALLTGREMSENKLLMAIRIEESPSGIFFAVSDGEPPLFVAMTNISDLAHGLSQALQDALVNGGVK